MEIVYKGHILNVNERLLEKNNVWESLPKIIEIRIEIRILLDMDKTLAEAKLLTSFKAKVILERLTDLEFTLQDAWGFDRDKNYHTYWLKLSGCTCPKMDNRELIGIDWKWVSEDCLYHGENST
jgi:hypothetical protein